MMWQATEEQRLSPGLPKRLAGLPRLRFGCPAQELETPGVPYVKKRNKER